MSAVKPVTIHQSAFSGGQNKDYAHTFRLGENTLRVGIHHDTSYSTQSHARIEVWTPAGWTQVASLHSTEVVTTQTEYVSNGTKPISVAAFSAVEKVLLKIATTVLS